MEKERCEDEGGDGGGGLPTGLPAAAWLAFMSDKCAMLGQDQGGMFPLLQSPYWPFGKLNLGK